MNATKDTIHCLSTTSSLKAKCLIKLQQYSNQNETHKITHHHNQYNLLKVVKTDNHRKKLLEHTMHVESITKWRKIEDRKETQRKIHYCSMILMTYNEKMQER